MQNRFVTYALDIHHVPGQAGEKSKLRGKFESSGSKAMRRIAAESSERNVSWAGLTVIVAAACWLLWLSAAMPVYPNSRDGHSGKGGWREDVTTQTVSARQADLSELKSGQPVEREIAGKGFHSYGITLKAGQYINVVVEQKGIDVSVRLMGPDGQKIAEVDSDFAVGVKSAFLVAEASGDYRLELRSSTKDAKTGRYTVKIEELREATSKDRVRGAAQKVFEEGNQFRDQRTAESRQQAIKKYVEALPLWRETEDKKGETDTLNEIGFVYANLGEPQKALEYYGQALSLSRVARYRAGEASALSNTGMAHWRLGEADKALEYHSQALQLWRAMGDRQSEAVTLNNIGAAYAWQGQLREALEYFNQALPLRRAAEDNRGEASTLNNIASIYEQSGELQKALEHFIQVLPLRRAAGDRRGEGNTLHNLGVIYHQLGELQKALDYNNQSLHLMQEVGDRQGEAIMLQSLGVIYLAAGELEKALEYSGQALALSQATGDRRQEAYVLNDIGKIHKRKGEPEKALAQFNQALPLRRAVGDRHGEIFTLSDIGDSHVALGDPQKALEYYHQSLQLCRDIGNRLDEAASLYGIARAQRKIGDLVEARTQIQAALDIIESTRSTVASQELRSSFLASNQDYYEFYIDLLMQMHKDQPSAGHETAALQASERSRARSLLEILIEARADIRQGVDPVLLERERTLQQQLSVKSERLTRLLGGKHTEEQAVAARKGVEVLLWEYQDTKAQIRTDSPRYAALTQPQPLGLKEIQQLLDGDTLLLEYTLGKDRGYLWAVTQTSISSHELPKRAEIDGIARRVYEALTARNRIVRFEKQDKRQARIAEADAEYFTASGLLSEMLLGPVASQLGRKRLLIVSEGSLQYVPFGALPIPNTLLPLSKKTRGSRTASYKPLIVEHEVVSLPSASVLAEVRKKLSTPNPGRKTVAVFADPVFTGDDPRVNRNQNEANKRTSEVSTGENRSRELQSELERSAREMGDLSFDRLPHTRNEADGILAHIPKGMGVKSLDFEASRMTATSADMKQYRIIHFATHGLLNSQHPELSGVVLSLVDRQGKQQDGFLRLYETYNLKLQADLVVLSACRTALGKEIKGEGLVGLTRGFMYAGAARVIASLWGVEDEATAELMTRFYREMLVKGRRPAAALRTAQIQMWRTKQLPPYYWAAFGLQGEWK